MIIFLAARAIKRNQKKTQRKNLFSAGQGSNRGRVDITCGPQVEKLCEGPHLPGSGLCPVAGLLFLHFIEGLFSRVREPACTSELGRYAGGSLTSGSATHAGQVLSEVPDKGGRCRDNIISS